VPKNVTVTVKSFPASDVAVFVPKQMAVPLPSFRGAQLGVPTSRPPDPMLWGVANALVPAAGTWGGASHATPLMSPPVVAAPVVTYSAHTRCPVPLFEGTHEISRAVLPVLGAIGNEALCADARGSGNAESNIMAIGATERARAARLKCVIVSHSLGDEYVQAAIGVEARSSSADAVQTAPCGLLFPWGTMIGTCV